MTPEQIDAALALYERWARLEVTDEEWRKACIAGYPEALLALRDALADGVLRVERVHAAEAKVRAVLALVQPIQYEGSMSRQVLARQITDMLGGSAAIKEATP